MRRIYSSFVSGATTKIKIDEQGDFVSVTHTDDFMNAQKIIFHKY